MNHQSFSTYFQKRLEGNPYTEEITELLTQRIQPSTKDVCTQSLQESLVSIPADDFRISTMTCIYQFGIPFNEYTLYDHAEDILKQSKEEYDTKESDFYIVGMECFDKPIVGEQIKKKRGQLSKRKFRNQMTIIVWSRAAQKYSKVKMFRTGKVQMTGVKSEEDGSNCIRYMIRLLSTFQKKLSLDSVPPWDPSKWQIAMMNGDFSVGYRISRELLHSIMCPKYGITSNLDADTYPGVIMKHNVGEKTITISVFSSGKVIVTGANARTQIEECVKLVKFLCSQLKTITIVQDTSVKAVE